MGLKVLEKVLMGAQNCIFYSKLRPLEFGLEFGVCLSQILCVRTSLTFTFICILVKLLQWELISLCKMKRKKYVRESWEGERNLWKKKIPCVKENERSKYMERGRVQTRTNTSRKSWRGMCEEGHRFFFMFKLHRGEV